MSAETARGPNLDLENLALFEGADPATLDELRRRAVSRKLSKGESLFDAGDEGDSMYVVAAGRIRIWTVSASGVEITLNVLPAGQAFGEIGLLDSGERTAAASAASACEVYSLDRASFFHALDRDPRIVRNTLKFLCERLRWMSARMEDSALRNAPERLARLLLYLLDDHGARAAGQATIRLALTQSELARWSMMSRESLNKILNRWSAEALLRFDRKEIAILAEERLREIATFGESES